MLTQTLVSFYLVSHVMWAMCLTSAPPSDKITDIEALEAFGDTTKNNWVESKTVDVSFGIAVIRYKGVFEPKVSRYRKT